MITPHESHSDFVEAFRRKIEDNRFEFETRGITIDDPDLGVFIQSVMEHGKKQGGADDFLKTFWQENLTIIGDIAQTSPAFIASRPFSISCAYRGKELGRYWTGKEIYDQGVYTAIDSYSKAFADSYLLPAHIAMKYLQNEEGARATLLSFLDFQIARNWTIVWAKTDWIRLVFPACYEKMMKDGEFLSVEELEEKMKEDVE